MESINNFGNIAKNLSKNPLGIIALFLVLTYAFASLVVGFSDKLSINERIPLIWFLVIFPFVELIIFSWLVSCHNTKLYAPSDYRDDSSFLETTKKIQILKEVSEQTENEEVKALNNNNNSSNDILENYLNKQNPQMAFIQMYIEIEKTLRRIASKFDIKDGIRHGAIPLSTLTNVLLKNEIIDIQTYNLIRDVIPIRNRIVHGEDTNFSLDMLEIGARILYILQYKEHVLEEQIGHY